MNYKLVRAYTDNGTFGKLYGDKNNFLCYTVEQVWDNNKPFKSCVMEGEYTLKDFESKKYGKTLSLVAPTLNVFAHKLDSNNRYACLFHPANYADQLQGCIAVGDRLGVLNDKYGILQWSVINSTNTLKKLNLQDGDTLTIIRR